MDKGQKQASAAVFDREAALHRAGDDAGFLGELIDLFLEDAALRMELLRDGTRDGDVGVLRAEGHSLKGSASAIAADRVAELAHGLERCGHDGDLTGATELMQALERELELLRPVLEAVRGEA